MSKPNSKSKNFNSKSSSRYFTKKIVWGISLILLGFFFLQMTDVVSIDNFFNSTVAAQSEKTIKADDNKINPAALQQIQALEDEKNSRTPAQQKIDSRLLYTIKMERGELLARGVPTLDTGLKADEKGFIDVEISANVSDELLARLNAVNAEIIAAFPQYHSITARLPIREIEPLAEMSEVIFIQPKLEATTNNIEPSKENIITDAPRAVAPKKSAPVQNSNKKSAPLNIKKKTGANFVGRRQRVREYLANQLSDKFAPQIGSVTSEADVTHRASLARTLSGANGTGLRIGVISNGVASLAARQASGDLPATVTVLPGQAGSGDEGTAMLELVYDLAPGAQLYFATANPTNAAFAQNIRDLRTAGCDIIVDDITYFNETPFQNGQAATVISPGNAGIIAQAVNDVTVGSQAGALYFSSAANSGNKNDNTAGVWEGDFVNGGATGAPIPLGNNVHNFGGGVTQNALTVAGRILLKWSDPLGASSNDYDLYVLNSAGTTVVASSANIQSGTQDPVEDAGNRVAGERIVIVKKAAAAARFLHLNTNRGVLTVSTAGVVYGHNAGLNTISVAATPSGPAVNNTAIGPFPNAHSSANVVETFSSDGPRRIFYNADSTLITPGNVSSTGGQLLQKPDITAADGSSTTTPGFIPFFGTSAAAPHAAAIAALVKSASPASTNAQILNALRSSAIDIEAAGTDRDSGTGIIMPLRAMAVLGVSGPAFLDNSAVTTSESVGNGNGRVEPGETANLTIPLNNLGLANATAISGTLTTSTSGVTIVAPQTQSYPNLAAAVGTGTSPSPYRFSLSNAFPCGGSINFTLTVNYTGGATASQTINFTVDTSSASTVATTLDTTAPPTGTNYTAITGTQTGRLNRNGIISNCASAKAAPPLQDATIGRRYDAYTYTASTAGCVTVTITPSNATALYSAAYNNSGYVPTSITSNYLADYGVTTAGTISYSFNVTAGQQFTVVVHEITVGGGIGVNYTLNVSGPIAGACTAFAPSAATATVSGRVLSANGRGIYNATLRLSGGNLVGTKYAQTNPFGYYRFQDLDVGQTYVLSVGSKRYTFANPTRIISLNEELTDANFMADGN